MHADGVAERDVLMGVGEQSGVAVSPEHLDLVAIATTAQPETAIGRDIELAGMGYCGLVADTCEQPRLAIDGKDGDALGFQTIA